jgi:sulfatase maturation enzyme AslB (radical SAM superfamily)
MPRAQKYIGGKQECNIMTVHFELTYDCPNRCNHCFNPNHSFRDEYLVIKIAEKIAVNDDIDKVVLTGGEPLFLGIGTLATLFEILQNKQISLNSTLIPLNNALINIVKGRVHGIVVSLHGNESVHNKITANNTSFAKTRQGIALAKGHALPISVNYVCRKDNVSIMSDTFIDLITNYKVDSFFASPVVMNEEAQSDLRLYSNDIQNILEALRFIKNTYMVKTRCLVTKPLSSFEFAYLYKDILISTESASVGRFNITPAGMIGPCKMEYKYYGSIFDDKNNFAKYD